MIVKDVDTKYNFQGTKFLRFEAVTVVPIQTKLVDVSIMSDDEIKWLNDYNERCLKVVGPLMDQNELAFRWLQRETMPILPLQ